MAVYWCNYCPSTKFAAPTQKLLHRHIRLVHSRDPSFSIKCSYSTCSRTFTNYRTWQNHQLKHRSVGNDTNDTDISKSMLIGQREEENNDSFASEHSEPDPPENDLTNYCAKWVLKIGETRNLTRTALIGIVEDTSELQEEVLLNSKHQIWSSLCKNGIDCPVTTSCIKRVLSVENATLRPFASLMTFQQQLKYYREHYNFVVSCLVHNFTNNQCRNLNELLLDKPVL